MKKTILNSFQIVWIAARLFVSDRAFAICAALSGLACLMVVGVTALALYAGRAIERIVEHGNVQVADAIFGFAAYLLACFAILCCHSMLVSSARDRIEGAFVDLQMSLEFVNSRLGAIFAWSALAGTFGFFVKRLPVNQQAHGIGKLAAGESRTGALVVPVMMIEDSGPFAALHRSDELLKRTWGYRSVPNFGFSIVYLYVVAFAMLAHAGLHFIAAPDVLSVGAGLAVFCFGVAMVRAIETIFAVDLYYYAVSGNAAFFPEDLLRNAYVPEQDRGRWHTRRTSTSNLTSFS